LKVKVMFVQEYYLLTRKHVTEMELPDGAKIRDLLNRLPEEVRKKLLDEKGEVKWPNMVSVNGRRIEFLQGLDTILKDGDTVIISPRPLFVV
jgi:molybdopterin synthase sulfur carrier subunit